MQKAVCDALQVCVTSEQTLTHGLRRGDAVLTNHINHQQISGSSIQDSARINQVESNNDPPDVAHECKKCSPCNPSSQHSKKDQDVHKLLPGSKQSQTSNGRLKPDSHSPTATMEQRLPKELWHSEQLEYFSKAIQWLEKVIKNLDQFELQWEKCPSK